MFFGHSQEFACSYSISMTVDVYGYLVPGAIRAAMDRLPALEDPVEESREGAHTCAEKCQVIFPAETPPQAHPPIENGESTTILICPRRSYVVKCPCKFPIAFTPLNGLASRNTHICIAGVT